MKHLTTEELTKRNAEIMSRLFIINLNTKEIKIIRDKDYFRNSNEWYKKGFCIATAEEVDEYYKGVD